MDRKYFDAIISEMQVLLDGQKFELDGDIYKNDKKAVKIEYNAEAKQFVLLVADVTDGAVGDFVAVSTWLFDETQNERDALAVGVDFADTLRGVLGVKKARAVANVDLPIAESSENATIAALTQKMLATFPQYKDSYKASVQKYNKFLYLDFYVTNFVPSVKVMLETGTKKQIKKLFDMLSDMYNTGNGETTDMIVALICASIHGDQEKTELATEHLSENKHLQTAIREFSATISKNKKIQAILIK